MARPPLQCVLARLCDPRDHRMQLLVAGALLAWEALFSAAIIARVPCAPP